MWSNRDVGLRRAHCLRAPSCQGSGELWLSTACSIGRASNLTVELTLSQYRLAPAKHTNENDESLTSRARGRARTMHQIPNIPLGITAPKHLVSAMLENYTHDTRSNETYVIQGV